jgi:uncharacterized protein YbjT (DUF2867 family)
MNLHKRLQRPIVLVTGATGAQGGSVARHLLERGRFAVRALTRNPDSEAARALEALGAELVRGDLFDRPGLRAAISGCYGVFGVTSYWEHFEREYEQGINLVDAVAEAGVGHFVFSTLPSVERLTDGALSVPHFDLKARMEEYARKQALPATFVHASYYYDNFLTFFLPRRQEDAGYRFGFPQGDTRLAGIAAEDIGGVVATVFERRDGFLGRTLPLAGDELSAAGYAAALSRVSGKEVSYAHVPREVFAGYGFPGAEDLANMFEYYRTRVPERKLDLCRTRELYPRVQGFEAWITRHRERFLTALAAA